MVMVQYMHTAWPSQSSLPTSMSSLDCLNKSIGHPFGNFLVERIRQSSTRNPSLCTVKTAPKNTRRSMQSNMAVGYLFASFLWGSNVTLNVIMYSFPTLIAVFPLMKCATYTHIQPYPFVPQNQFANPVNPVDPSTFCTLVIVEVRF